MLEALTVLLLLIAAAVLYSYFRRRYSYWSSRGVKTAPTLPVVGSVLPMIMLKRTPGQFMHDLYKQEPGEDIVGFYIFGRPAVLVRPPELLRSVLVKDFNHFSDRFNVSDPVKDPLGARNLFTIKGPEWKYLRAKLSPTFTSGKMKAMYPLVARCDRQLIDHIMTRTNEDGVAEIDIKEAAARCTTDTISNCAFGIDSNSLRDSDAEFRGEGKKMFDYNIRRSLEVLVFFFVPHLVRLLPCSYFQKDATKFMRRAFWETLQERERRIAAGDTANRRHDLVDHLIQLKNQGSIQRDEDDNELDFSEPVDESMSKKFDFSGDDLLAQSAIFFTAGFETTSSTISFCLYEMACHPEMQSRLRSEIRKECVDGITYNVVTRMKYLDMVISETLRKYPTLPFLDRTCLQDWKAPNGVVIEKGTPVFTSISGLHHDPKYFPRPEKFDPERFADKSTIHPFSYMPFGEGPHICIGMRFGLMSAKAGVTHVLSQFWVSPGAETPKPLPIATRGLVVSTEGDIRLRFQKDPLF